MRCIQFFFESIPYHCCCRCPMPPPPLLPSLLPLPDAAAVPAVVRVVLVAIPPPILDTTTCRKRIDCQHMNGAGSGGREGKSARVGGTLNAFWRRVGGSVAVGEAPAVRVEQGRKKADGHGRVFMRGWRGLMAAQKYTAPQRRCPSRARTGGL